MGYNPNAHEPTRGQAEFDDREIPAGVYLLGPAWMKCPSERSWKARFDVLMGPFSGASCFVLQGRDTNKTGTQNRLFYYVKSAGLLGELETLSSGLLTERGLRADVLGHAIKAKVTRKVSSRQGSDGVTREFVDYDFAVFHARDEWSANELAIAKKWEAAYIEAAADRNGDPAGGFGDDPGPSGDGGGGGWGNDDWG